MVKLFVILIIIFSILKVKLGEINYIINIEVRADDVPYICFYHWMIYLILILYKGQIKWECKKRAMKYSISLISLYSCLDLNGLDFVNICSWFEVTHFQYFYRPIVILFKVIHISLAPVSSPWDGWWRQLIRLSGKRVHILKLLCLDLYIFAEALKCLLWIWVEQELSLEMASTLVVLVRGEEWRLQRELLTDLR